MVQVTLGQNNGQGMRCGSRHYWDEDTDDVCHVSLVTDKKFILVIAYAVYMYWSRTLLTNCAGGQEPSLLLIDLKNLKEKYVKR